MRKRGVRVALSVGFAAALLAACSSSSSSNNASAPKQVQAAGAGVTTTTAPVAIGLRRNADEQGELVPDKPLTHPQRQALADQLMVARAVALKYPTVKDALAAGYIQAGRFTPGAGAHFISYSGAAQNFLGKGGTQVKASDPLALIYEGISPTSRVTGLMYGSFALNVPDGFTGPNDHWHRHTNLCITFDKGKIGIPFPPDVGVKKSECDKYPHSMFMRRSLWMVHAWVVPGWESPEGVFSHANVDLHCADGTDKVDSTGFCTGAA